MGNTAESLDDGRVLEDAWCLIKHVSQISVWESKKMPEMVRIGHERLQFRRKMEIRRLSGNIRKALYHRVAAFC